MAIIKRCKFCYCVMLRSNICISSSILVFYSLKEPPRWVDYKKISFVGVFYIHLTKKVKNNHENVQILKYCKIWAFWCFYDQLLKRKWDIVILFFGNDKRGYYDDIAKEKIEKKFKILFLSDFQSLKFRNFHDFLNVFCVFENEIQ